MGKAQRKAERNRWRKQRVRVSPSPSAVFRYLARFHNAAEEARRVPNTAFIPAANEALRGLAKVNADLVRFAGGHMGHKVATLDMDATLVGTHKREATYCYKKHKAYQPLTTYWREADLVVHSEFRDGNVNAGYEQLRVMKRLALGEEWMHRRMKAVRFGIICVAGRVVKHARRLVIRLPRGHPACGWLAGARLRIRALAATPLAA